MSKQTPSKNKRKGELGHGPTTVAGKQNTSTESKEDFAGLFRPLEGEAPKVRLDRPGDNNQTPASSVYHDARSSKEDVSGKPSATVDDGSATDRSTSPFEIIYDEASRDLARTPSPDRYPSDVDEPTGSSACHNSPKPAASQQVSSKTGPRPTGKKRRRGKRNRKSNPDAFEGDEKGKQCPESSSVDAEPPCPE